MIFNKLLSISHPVAVSVNGNRAPLPGQATHEQYSSTFCVLSYTRSTPLPRWYGVKRTVVTYTSFRFTTRPLVAFDLARWIHLDLPCRLSYTVHIQQPLAGGVFMAISLITIPALYLRSVCA